MIVNYNFSNLKKAIIPKFYPLISNKQKVLIIYGGSNSGKSHFVAQKLLLRILATYDKGIALRFLIVKKTGPSLRKNCFQLIIDYISKWNLKHLCNINKTDMTITFSNKSMILFVSCDDPEKLKGVEGINSAWIEEATGLDPKDIRQVSRILRDETSYRQLILTFNPTVDAKPILKSYPESIRVGHHRSTYLDNPFSSLSPEDIAGDSEYDYEVYVLGKLGLLKESIYTNWTVEDLSMLNTYMDIVYGLDFGFNNPSCLLKVGISEDKIYILDEYYERRKTNSDLIKDFKDIVSNRYVIKADSAEPDRIEEISNNGFYIEKANKNVNQGIDWLRRKKIIINKNCLNTIEEIENYKYKKIGDDITEIPIKEKDHAMDALRYAVSDYIMSFSQEIEYKTVQLRETSNMFDNF